MSITAVKARPGWFDVRVYDRVRVPGQRPRAIDRRVKGRNSARDLERDLKNRRDRGSLQTQNLTLSAYAAACLRSRRAEVSRRTLSGYTAIVQRYVDRHAIGGRRVGSVDVTTVSDFYADLLDGVGRDRAGGDGRAVASAPISVETVRSVHRVLSMILKRATVDGLLYVNPCVVAKPPKNHRDEVERPERGLDPLDARFLLRALEGTEVSTAAAIALSTGLRLSEFLALRWQDVDLEEKELHVSGKLEQVGGLVERRSPKTKRSRRAVPFSEAVAKVFRAQRARIAERRLTAVPAAPWVDERWVFPSLTVSVTKERDTLPAGRCWTPNAFAQAWRRAMDTANGRLLGEHVAAGGRVQEFEPLSVGVHALRHTYATMQLRAGVRDEVVSRRLGHSSSLVTRMVYSHATTEEKRDGVDVTDAALGFQV